MYRRYSQRSNRWLNQMVVEENQQEERQGNLYLILIKPLIWLQMRKRNNTRDERKSTTVEQSLGLLKHKGWKKVRIHEAWFWKMKKATGEEKEVVRSPFFAHKNMIPKRMVIITIQKGIPFVPRWRWKLSTRKITWSTTIWHIKHAVWKVRSVFSYRLII